MKPVEITLDNEYAKAQGFLPPTDDGTENEFPVNLSLNTRPFTNQGTSRRTNSMDTSIKNVLTATVTNDKALINNTLHDSNINDNLRT